MLRRADAISIFDLPQIRSAKSLAFFGGHGPLCRTAIVQDWNPIASAPRDRDLHLSVIEDGEVYALVFPCRRKGSQWVDARTGGLVDINPTHWREWSD